MLVVWGLLTLLTCFILLLAIPVDLAFSVQRHGRQQTGTGTVRWLFGLVQLNLPKPLKSQKPEVHAKPKRFKTKRRSGKRTGRQQIMPLFFNDGFVWRLMRLAVDLLQRIHIRDLRLALRLGMDDPADTGRLWAVIGPLTPIVTFIPAAYIIVEPEFTAAVFDINGMGDIRIIPIQLVMTILAFLLAPATLRTLHTLITAR